MMIGNRRMPHLYIPAVTNYSIPQSPMPLFPMWQDSVRPLPPPLSWLLLPPAIPFELRARIGCLPLLSMPDWSLLSLHLSIVLSCVGLKPAAIILFWGGLLHLMNFFQSFWSDFVTYLAFLPFSRSCLTSHLVDLVWYLIVRNRITWGKDV